MRVQFVLILGSWALPCVLPQTTETTVFYAPNPGYDAYWTNGHWVFGTTSGSTTTLTPGSRFTRVQPKHKILVCGQPCARIYRKMKGKVCAHQIDNIYRANYSGRGPDSNKNKIVDWTLGGQLDRNYDYLKTYNSYCEFKDAQCRTKIYHNMGVVFIHMGPCLQDSEVYHPLIYGSHRQWFKLNAIDRYYKQFDDNHKEFL